MEEWSSEQESMLEGRSSISRGGEKVGGEKPIVRGGEIVQVEIMILNPNFNLILRLKLDCIVANSDKIKNSVTNNNLYIILPIYNHRILPHRY